MLLTSHFMLSIKVLILSAPFVSVSDSSVPTSEFASQLSGEPGLVSSTIVRI
jgi:hypothetical protein